MSEQNADAQPVVDTTAPAPDQKPPETQTPEGQAPEATQPATEAPPKVEEKSADEKAATEEFEIKDPEGVELAEDYKKSLAEYAKQHGFTAEQAQKMAQRELSLLGEYEARQKAEQDRLINEVWVDQIKSDPQLGGAKFDANMEIASRPLKKYADPEFVNFLNESGYGNHPGLVRFCHKLGLAMANDQAVMGPAGAIDTRPLEERMYPSMVKKS